MFVQHLEWWNDCNEPHPGAIRGMAMKKYIAIVMMFLVSGVAFAAGSMFDGMSKEELGNYEIQVVDKRSGQVVGRMSRAEYKVVRIGSISEREEIELNYLAQRQAEVAKDQKVVDKYKAGYTTVIVHAGVGNDGLDTSHNGSAYEVTEKMRAVGGLTGCRSVEGKGLCASAFTNETYTLGVKFDF